MRILAIVALAIIALGVVGYAFATHGGIANVLLRAASRLGLSHQGIQGNATIWYWAVNCPATTGDIGISLNVTSANGRTVQYPLNWSFFGGITCDLPFETVVAPGVYSPVYLYVTGGV